MLLAFYLALAWLPFVIDRMQGDIQDAPLQRGLGTFAVLTFLAWRVSRGGTTTPARTGASSSSSASSATSRALRYSFT